MLCNACALCVDTKKAVMGATALGKCEVILFYAIRLSGGDQFILIPLLVVPQ
jgi:hypothetical protein